MQLPGYHNLGSKLLVLSIGLLNLGVSPVTRFPVMSVQFHLQAENISDTGRRHDVKSSMSSISGMPMRPLFLRPITSHAAPKERGLVRPFVQSGGG